MTDATGGAAPTDAASAAAAAAQADASQAKPLTAADFEAMLAAHLPKVVNAAVTSHTKRLEKDFAARIAALTPAQAAAAEGAEATALDDAASDAASKAAKPAGATTAQPDPRIAALEAKLAKLARDNEKAQAQAASERKQRLEDQGHEQIRAALRGKVHAGVEDDILDAWRARRAVVIGDDGATRVRFGGQDEPEEGFDVQAAVAAFLKTDRAKHYIPAPANGAQRGAGARPPLMGRPAIGGATDPAGAFEQKHGVPLGKAILGRT